MRKKERVTANVLDAMIQIISLAIVQNHPATKIKRLSLEVLEAIAKMTPKTKPTTKLVSWLNRQMRIPAILCQMADFLAVRALCSAHAIVVKLKLVAQWKSSSILLPFTSPNGVSATPSRVQVANFT
nr:hypothetical protein [Tanacetum cinerariifolium]